MKLKLREVAQYLDLPLNTVERWVRQGRIPIRRTGSQCIFKKAVLEKWAAKHNISFNLPDQDATESGSTDKQIENHSQPLVSALKRGDIHHISGNCVEDVLKNSVECMPGFSDNEKKVLFDKLIEREKLTSTGIGKGIAIPHPRTPMPGENNLPIIATFFLKNQIDFGAIDDQSVNIMFVIVCPSVQSHLQLLSRISFCIRNDSFISFLNTHPDPELFFNKVSEIENDLE